MGQVVRVPSRLAELVGDVRVLSHVFADDESAWAFDLSTVLGGAFADDAWFLLGQPGIEASAGTPGIPSAAITARAAGAGTLTLGNAPGDGETYRVAFILWRPAT